MITNGSTELAARLAELSRGRPTPLMVAFDGRSGAGKSMLAAAVAAELGAAVIDGDDFYSGGTATEWDAMTSAERADRCIDWRRQRTVLEASPEGKKLRGGRTTGMQKTDDSPITRSPAVPPQW